MLLLNQMVKYRDDTLSDVFSALSDPTRRAILARLALGETTVSELAEPFDMSLPAVSKHLKVLEGAGLLVRERHGRLHLCQINGAAMRKAADWIEYYRAFWDARLDSLDDYLVRTTKPTKQKPSGGKNG
jgi:DNA-binding transcriptional ArsR family regulator